MRLPPVLLGTAWLAAPLCSQTLVVGGPSGFPEIAAAVAAAPSGATILVRPGTYQGFQVVNKSLAILCDPNALVAGEVFIGSIAAMQSVTLRGLTWAAGWVPSTVATAAELPELLTVASCQGRVLLDSVDTSPAATLVSHLILTIWTPGLVAADCAQLAIRDSTFLADCSLTNCTTAIESSSFTGIYEANGNLIYNTPGLQVTGGSVRVGGSSTFQGAQGYYPANQIEQPVPASAGLALLGADAQFVDGSAQSLLTAHPGDQGGIHVYAGQLRLAPRAVVNAVTGAFAGALTPMPAVRSSGSLAAGAMTATVESEPNDLVIVLVGLAGAPQLVAPFQDGFWLDPAAFAFHTIAVQPAGSLTASLTLPANPGLRGLVLTWQVVADGPLTGLAASNPSLTVVH